MAGPGGGPPRKSHTKSRKGCKTCKRRHIRCDETFPQCRNCTKHNCRCDYMDSPAASEDRPTSPRNPDLLLTPEIQREVEAWHATGIPTYPELQMSSAASWKAFKLRDLRLVHHIAGLSIDMHRRGLGGCSIWSQKMPTFLTIGMSSDFVMSAILALSAANLAWRNENPETEALFYYHRGIALKGLHEAIGNFSRENSDSILAASMILSWLASEWKHWASLQQGISSVLNSMQPWWKQDSELAVFLEDQRLMRRAQTPATPSFNAGLSCQAPENVARVDHARTALATTRQRVAHSPALYEGKILELERFLHDLRADLPVQSPEAAFTRMQQLRSWLFWLPAFFFRSSSPETLALAILAQFYGAALAVEPLFPEIGGAYLGSVVVAPLKLAHNLLVSKKIADPYSSEVQFALDLIDWPVQMLSEYEGREGITSSPIESYRSVSQEPNYSIAGSQLSTSPEFGHYDTYTASTASSANLGVSSSPYHAPNPADIGPRRHSPYLPPTSVLQVPLVQPPTSYSPYDGGQSSTGGAYGYDQGGSRMGYYDMPHVHHQTEGFVAPLSMWT